MTLPYAAFSFFEKIHLVRNKTNTVILHPAKNRKHFWTSFSNIFETKIQKQVGVFFWFLQGGCFKNSSIFLGKSNNSTFFFWFCWTELFKKTLRLHEFESVSVFWTVIFFKVWTVCFAPCTLFCKWQFSHVVPVHSIKCNSWALHSSSKQTTKENDEQKY